MANFTKYITLLFLVLLSNAIYSAEIIGKITDTNNKPVAGVEITIDLLNLKTETDDQGSFSFKNLEVGQYFYRTKHKNFQESGDLIDIQSLHQIVQTQIVLFEKVVALGPVIIHQDKPIFGNGSDVSEGELTTDKTKLEVQPTNAQTSTSSPGRALPVPVTFIENDGAGLQLGIGGRGLNPKRTAHYNTRQNGYDISADALGYPETYYTPPTEAINSITLLRGAASLQYGPQFGGMINFKLNESTSENQKHEFISKNSYGSYNQYHSFNSFGTHHKKISTYSFYHLKTGEGWRANSDYTSHTGYTSLKYTPNEQFNIALQLTHHQYLAQQAGGLTDLQFEQDPQISFRERNWFKINWNIGAVVFNYKFNSKTWINNRTFAVIAQRQSLGYLQSPNLIDVGGKRTLINGDFQNYGNETRFFKRQEFNDSIRGVFLAGMRLYKGSAITEQGLGDETSKPNFTYLNPNQPENSRYKFPSKNLSLFAENAFYIGKKWSITPGIRYEFIRTESEGYYNKAILSMNGDTLDVYTNEQAPQTKDRHILLSGIGVGYKLKNSAKIIANVSQNFRSVNFSDINIVIPNFRVDPNISDERGASIDLGINKTWDKKAFLSISAYGLFYANRIGVIWKTDPETFDTYQYRTNVSASRSIGMELSNWINISGITPLNDSLHQLMLINNVTITDARYTEKGTVVEGNRVEMVPFLTVKSGITYSFKKFSASVLFNLQTEQYSEATNSEFSANGLFGTIPTFYVMDAKASYQFKFITAEVSVNNFANHMYFTQRATSYPGPGIIPSEGRTFWGSLIFQF